MELGFGAGAPVYQAFNTWDFVGGISYEIHNILQEKFVSKKWMHPLINNAKDNLELLIVLSLPSTTTSGFCSAGTQQFVVTKLYGY